MSTRGYLSPYTCHITQEEDPPVCLRLQRSRATVTDLHRRLQQASQRDAVRCIRRTTVGLDLLVPHGPVARRSDRWGRSPSWRSQWRQAFLLRGMDRLVSHHRGGRQPQLTLRQQKRLGELLEAGPLVVGGETAWWTAVRLRGLIWRACGVRSNRPDVCTWRPTRGGALPQARFGSEPLDAAKRRAWLQDTWPTLVRAATRGHGLRRFAAEARCAPWGALRSTGARRGQHPEGPTSGQRKGDTGFGAMESCAGRLFSQGLEGRLASDSAHAFLQRSLAHTTAHLCLIHDGARAHTSAATQAFLAAQRARMTAAPFPSYAPDDNPLAYLWKKTTQRATPHKSCKEFIPLTVSGDQALASVATHPATVFGVCGRSGAESGVELKQAA